MTAAGWWNEQASAAVKLALAAAALALVAGSLASRRRGHDATNGRPSPSGGDAASQRWRRWIARLFGALGILAYFNFGAFHFGGIYLHLWDGLHHYLGAKYADEIGYDGLYECLALADAEHPELLGVPAAERVLTDLRTNQMTTAASVIADPDRCHARFSAGRWADFTADVSYFRARFPTADWQAVTRDHGFNASPVWLLFAHPLVGRGPVTTARLGVLAALDPFLMLAAFAALVWAFGWERTALVAVVWGTYFPGRLWWTGGSLLRWDWLAALLGGLALLRRGRPFGAGALMGYAALSRVFPLFALAGATLGLLGRAVGRRSVDRATVRLLVGAAVTAAVLIPCSAAARRGDVWSAFVRNLAKHTSVPSPNRMGLAPLLAFDAASTSRKIGEQSHDARGRWEAAQVQTLEHRRVAWIALALAGAAAIAFAVREQPAWAACTLGLLLIPLLRPLACYYYAFVAALPLLGERRPEAGGIAVALALASGIVAAMSRFGTDEQYVAQSLLVIVAFGFMASSFLAKSATSVADA